MVIRHIDAVMDLGPEVSGARRMVLVVLAEHADAEGFCYPGRKRIAERAGITRLATVTEALGWLEENGYITRDVNAWAGRDGQIPERHRSNLYRVLVDNQGVVGGSRYAQRTPEVRSAYPRGTLSVYQKPHRSLREAPASYPQAGEVVRPRADEVSPEIEHTPEVAAAEDAEYWARHDESA